MQETKPSPSDNGSNRAERVVAKRAARLLGGAGIIAGVWLAMPGQALAQAADTGAPGASDPQAQGGIITVTAQKRTENIRDVPLSVSVLGSADLLKQHVADYGDLARIVPGLSFTNSGNTGTSNIALRGIAATSGSSTVGVYLDDVALSFPNQFFTGTTLPRLFDLSRVEVLRGPQGTLYGDSSLGGTIRFITNQPKLGAWEGYAAGDISTTKGGGTNYKVDGTVNVPIGDNAALRVAGEMGRRSGYIEHVDADGDIDKHNVDSERYKAVRATLLWQPTDSLKIVPSIQWQLTKAADSSIFDISLPRYEENKQVPEWSRDRMVAPSLTIDKTFGDYSLTAVTSYMARNFTRDMDATIYDSEYVAGYIDDTYGANYNTIGSLPGILHNSDRIKNLAEEVRFSSPSISAGHRFEWQVGAYLNSLKARSLDDEYVEGLNSTVEDLYGESVEDLIGYSAPNDQLGYYHSTRRIKQVAEFAEGSFMITPQLKATVGLRHVNAWTKYELKEGGWLADGTPVDDKASSKDSPVTPKFALSYTFNKDITFYGSATKGFRLGGENNALPSYCASSVAALGLTTDQLKSYKSDSLWAYELGFKSGWLGNRIKLNGSIYRIDWNDVQQSIRLSSCGYVTTANAGDARSQGGELELSAQVTPTLTFSATGNVTNAHITKTGQGSVSAVGQKILGVPDKSLTVGLDFNKPVTQDVRVFASTNWQYTGKSHGTFDTTDTDYRRPSYWVGNLNVGVAYKDMTFSLYVNNLANDRTIIQRPSELYVEQGLTVQARTIGATASKTF